VHEKIFCIIIYYISIIYIINISALIRAVRIANRKMISWSYPISGRWCVFSLMACIYRQFRSYSIYRSVEACNAISILSTSYFNLIYSRLNQIG